MAKLSKEAVKQSNFEFKNIQSLVIFFMLNNDKMDANFDLGVKMLNNNFYERSISEFQKSLESDSENYATLNNIGFALLSLGILEKNIEMIKRATFYLKKAGFVSRIVNGHTFEYDNANGNLIQANFLLENKNLLKTKI